MMAERTEPDVGQRIRTLREQRGLSLRSLGERSGLSINAISLIERGENSPTVSSLHRLATALQVPITELFREEEKQVSVLVKHNRGLRSQSDGIVMESLGAGLLDLRLEPFRLIIDPGAGNTDDPIVHPGEEFVHCIEGKIEYLVGDQVYHLEKGDSLLFDATEPHCLRNPTEVQAVALMVFQADREGHLGRQVHVGARAGTRREELRRVS